MKTLFALAAVALFTTATWAAVWPVIYQYDEKTPLTPADPNEPVIYRDIMVGTHLTILIRSDQQGEWTGGLVMTHEDAAYGEIRARGDYYESDFNYALSCLPDAGEIPGISPWVGPMVDERVTGYQFSSTPNYWFVERPAVPGDWFIFDYLARQTGPCKLELYDYNVPPDTNSLSLTPILILSLNHVPSRDFNADRVVDWRDFARLASAWRSTHEQDDPNGFDAPCDLDENDLVDANDVTLFCEFWLERTDGPEAGEPNEE